MKSNKKLSIVLLFIAAFIAVCRLVVNVQESVQMLEFDPNYTGGSILAQGLAECVGAVLLLASFFIKKKTKQIVLIIAMGLIVLSQLPMDNFKFFIVFVIFEVLPALGFLTKSFLNSGKGEQIKEYVDNVAILALVVNTIYLVVPFVIAKKSNTYISFDSMLPMISWYGVALAAWLGILFMNPDDISE